MVHIVIFYINKKFKVTYIRYVEDYLVASKTLNDNDAIFEKLNSLHEKIGFTRELEKKIQLPFLYIMITKDKTKSQRKSIGKQILLGNTYITNRFVIRSGKLT